MPPDNLAQRIARYEHPTAELELERVRDVVLDAVPKLHAIRAVDNLHFLLAAVQSTSAGFVVRGLAKELQADLDGYVTVSVICPGPGSAHAEPDPERDGSFELNLRITDAALEPVVFGAAHGCKVGELPANALPDWLPALEQPLAASLDGPVAIHLGAPLVLGRETQLTPLVYIGGQLAIEGLPTLQDFDFRMPRPGVLELGLEISGKSLVLVLDADAVRIRERRGTWVCEGEAGVSCSAEF